MLTTRSNHCIGFKRFVVCFSYTADLTQKSAEVIVLKAFGAIKASDITRQQLMSAAKKLGFSKKKTKDDKASLLMAVVAGLLDKHIIKVAEGVDGSNVLRKDVIRVCPFSVFCNLKKDFSQVIM